MKQNLDIDTVVSRHDGTRGGLIAMLEEIQAAKGYLPQDMLVSVAEKTNRSLADVYGVATFYKAFTLKPTGEHLISVCLGTACHVRGGAQIVEEFERQLGVSRGETTADNQFTLQTVNCLGACALGPVVVVDGHYFSHVAATRVKGILAKARRGLDAGDLDSDETVFAFAATCPACKKSLMDEESLIDGRPSVRVAVSYNGDTSSLRLSSLHGSSGAVAENNIPLGEIVQVLCPHCGVQMSNGSLCSDCGAPLVELSVGNNAALEVCSRHGCSVRELSVGRTDLEWAQTP